VAGFLLASAGHPNLALLLAVLVGTSLVIASACVFNNYIDRGIDQRMDRTKQRALASGQIKPAAALTYATVLGLIGFGVLARYTSWLVVVIGLVAFVDYVILYGISKRRSVHGTLVGSICGAAPIVAGYCAVTGRFDLGALLLFIILALWQMPHFYAIAIYRLDDYTAAGLPVLPVRQGVGVAKRQIVAYIVAFMVAVTALSVWGYASYIVAVVVTLLGLWWLRLAIGGFKVADDSRWARGVFRFSLVVLLGFCIMISLSSVLS
jgi:protoheme IX farnesyltransferase